MMRIQPLLNDCHKEGEGGDRHSRERVINPVQNPNTTPETIANCSNAMSEPRSSGGLISAMYNGESMLY